LAELAKLEHVDTCDDNVENYKFIVIGRDARQKVIRIKKNGS